MLCFFFPVSVCMCVQEKETRKERKGLHSLKTHMDSHATAAQALYAWLFEISPTLSARRPDLTPRLELRAHANGMSYDVTASFFAEMPVSIPVSLLPRAHGEALAAMAESSKRTHTFATVKPAMSGSGVVLFRHFVWDFTLCTE